MTAAASQAQALAESIINTVREPLIVLDKEFRVVQANRSFHEMFRTLAIQIQDRSFFQLAGGQWDVPQLHKLLDSLLPGKTTIESFEIEIDMGDVGTRVMVLNADAIQRDGAPDPMFLLTIKEKTERHAAKEYLMDSQARLTAILESAPDAIITCDEKGIVGSFSPAAEKIFGYSAEEVIGKNVNMLMAQPHRHEHDGYLSHYRETGEKKIIGIGREVTGRRKDGSHVPVRLSVSELWIGKRRLFTGILHDLTQEKKRQEELRRAQKMEAVGQLTGGIAHDFNNLLTVVIGNLELLQMNPNGKNNEESVSMALEAAELGAQLTQQLLTFAKRQPLKPRPVALNDLIESIHPLLQRSISEKINIETRLEENLDMTMADPGQIENALLNMAINARDAMSDGGTLTIKTSSAVLDADYAANQIDVEPGPYVLLSVTDTGYGMTPDVIERAFEPFFTTKGLGEGTGLGLSMIYGFAKQSGGHLAIYSEVGKGTTINLYLPPAAKAANGKSDAKSSGFEDSLGAQGERILVVEDDPRVRKLTITRLDSLGYSVLSATNGPEAVKIIKSNNELDLVLSDYVMPGGMTGLDVANKALMINPKLKVLLATGYAEGTGVLSGDSSTNGFRILRKPYRIGELALTLRQLLD